MTVRIALAALIIGTIFAAAAWSTTPIERRRSYLDRAGALRRRTQDRAALFARDRRIRTILGCSIAVLGPWIFACLTLSVWWLEHHLPISPWMRDALSASVSLNQLVSAITAAVGALLIRGSIQVRVAVGMAAGVMALPAYEFALRAVDAVFGMSIVPA